VGQHARTSTAEKCSSPKNRWVNMQEQWVNINRNGGSTWAGIYTYERPTIRLPSIEALGKLLFFMFEEIKNQ
jgi:hypothetical protein